MPTISDYPHMIHSRTSAQAGALGRSIQNLWAITAARNRHAQQAELAEVPDSPKTPQLPLETFPENASRLSIPGLSRASSNASRRPQYLPPSPTSQVTSPRPVHSRPVSPSALRALEGEAEPTSPGHRHVPQRFVGVDPGEQELGETVNTRRERQRRRARRVQSRKFSLENRKVRRKVIGCSISGGILMILLSAYLALALSNKLRNQEFSILIILIILIDTIFFCHALIRLCMMAIRPPSDNDNSGLPSMVGPNGYANPAAPIPVALARDEEAAGIESEITKLPPPAYGLWRESVRVDPNRIFWQRNETAEPLPQNATESPDRPVSVHRPPSYNPEDGIRYISEEELRAQAAAEEAQNQVPLPTHPSERERARRTMQQRQSTRFATGGRGAYAGSGFAA